MSTLVETKVSPKIIELLGEDNYQKLVDNHKQQDGKQDYWPVVRLNSGRASWLLTELDPNHPDAIAFGLCDLGRRSPTLSNVSIMEIMENSYERLELGYFFKAQGPLSVYAEKSQQAGEIVNGWPKDDDSDELLLSTEADVEKTEAEENVLNLSDFIHDFREPLLEQVEKQTPVFFKGDKADFCPQREKLLGQLKRTPFEAQNERIHAVTAGLLDRNLPAVVLNGEMGTGKTFMSIAVAHLCYNQFSTKPTLVLSPPHLVYKWRREILDTIPGAKVEVINGANAINQLIRIRKELEAKLFGKDRPTFVIIGRVRMRMGFHWRAAYTVKKQPVKIQGIPITLDYIACSDCGETLKDKDGEPVMLEQGAVALAENRTKCKSCGSPMWTMKHQWCDDSKEKMLKRFLNKLPGIGKKTSEKLIDTYGVENLTNIVDDNIYEFVNLSKEDGDFFFTDKHCHRLEKALGNIEFALRLISYQPSEYVKRYFPKKTFGLAIIDEAHEYKNSASAQGQAMGVLCNEADKVLPLTGTLMGGYASDLFHLLFRIMPGEMVKHGFAANKNNSMASAEMAFMRDYGCLIDVYKQTNGGSHQTAKGNRVTLNVKKAPGFSSLGISQFILPFTVFMRLADLGEGVLPEYTEETRIIQMTDAQAAAYGGMRLTLRNEMREALRKGDKSLTGLVINALLRWPDTGYQAEKLVHPRTKVPLYYHAPVFAEDEISPKEQDVINYVKANKVRNRRVMLFTTYTGRFDTGSRLKKILADHGFKVALLKSNVPTTEREMWIDDKVERGIDVLICNPELVKTGLDLLAFPSIYFTQTGYNVYTLMQASRRSWRIGQDQPVEVAFGAYDLTTQMDCLSLMSKKVKVQLSTSGVMPETGIEDNDDDSEGLMTELAKSLLQ